MKPIRLFTALLLFPLAVASADNNDQDSDAPESRAAMEQSFAEKLSGAALVGVFSIDGRSQDGPPHTERYEIAKVEKAGDGYWTFHARMKYGNVDLTIPLTLQVLWAGDTPVITLTNLTIPGMGTFTARVLIHGDRYVGTWQHDAVGGHMWGKIERAAKPKE